MEIDTLPNELIGVIYEYVRPHELRCCNTAYFTRYLVPNRQSALYKSSYLRFLLRNDMHYVFGILMRRNANSIFRGPGTYVYGRRKYSQGFTAFMEQYCINNQSQRCRQIIRDLK